jgi:hypothetical protein
MISSSGSFTTREVAHLLSTAQSGRFVLQDFAPLAESLEWELGGRYLADRGSRAFLSDPVPVPYAVNNSGSLSRQAAEVLLAALDSHAVTGDIFVLEVGIGLGLFARYFLDAFRDRCASTGRDYYDRLTYVAADSSERMLLDVARRGTFHNHPGRYQLRRLDARDPQAWLANDPMLSRGGDRPFVAVFLNYLLDCLPTTVLRIEPETTKGGESHLSRLCVRTCLARGSNLRDYTDERAEDLAQRARSSDENDRRPLLNLFPILTTEYDYRPIRTDELPYQEFVDAFARREKGTVVYNHGAIAYLRKLLPLVQPWGFVLANDYGSAEFVTANFEHQRYTGSTFVGVNFALLKEYFTTVAPVHWAEPAEDNGRIFSRMLGHNLHPDVVSVFRERFAKAAWERMEEPTQAARAHVGQGRVEAAAADYTAAVRQKPCDWLLLCEVANFLTFSLRDPWAGVELARAEDQGPDCPTCVPVI